MKKLLFVLMPVFLCSVLSAETLEEKVDRLEKKVNALELLLAPVIREQAQRQVIQELRNQARIRAQQDMKTFTREQLAQIEALYQAVGKKEGDEQKAVALILQEKYPKANRTGCIMLYLAQITQGEAQIELLKQVIRDYSDCFYFDGAQVGPLARFYLGKILERDGKKEEAQACLDELRKLYPNAIGHNGEPLSADLPK